MLHIVLLVLKILGILLLVLLGLVLLLLLAGLTVPVRYGIRGSYYGKIKGSIKITWLLHSVSAVISYDGEPFVRVKLLGIPVYRPDKRKAAKIGREALDSLEPEIPGVKEAADEAGKKLFGTGRKKQKKSGKAGADTHKDGKKDVPPVNMTGSPKRQAADTKEPEAVPEKNPQGLETGERPGTKTENPTAVQETQEPMPEGPKGDSNSSGKNPFRFLIKIRKLIKSLPQKAAGIIKKLRRLYRGVKSGLCQADTFVKTLKAWIEDEENKKMIREIWRHAKALIRHGLPKKVKGKVVFGFDDPYITGQVLSYGAMLYPFYGRQINVQPVFDRVIFECEGTIKGRIRVSTVCYRLLRAYRNKKFKALIQKWMG